MSGITSHVLDTSLGRPAKGVSATLEHKVDGKWVELGFGVTNDDGRISKFLPDEHVLQAGVYRLTFDTAAYFKNQKLENFYPEVPILFQILDAKQHYHVPLLLNPFGYSTYRGS